MRRHPQIDVGKKSHFEHILIQSMVTASSLSTVSERLRRTAAWYSCGEVGAGKMVPKVSQQQWLNTLMRHFGNGARLSGAEELLDELL